MSGKLRSPRRRNLMNYVSKMVSAAKMKCVQCEKDLNYAMHVEICASLCSLNAEKRPMTIQMQVEKVKKNKVVQCN
jgi:hypothetical protein